MQQWNPVQSNNPSERRPAVLDCCTHRILSSVEAHGDEEVGADYIPEELMEEEFWGYGGEEGDDPPEVSEEELEQLDTQAKEKEINRMLEMPAMVEVEADEVELSGGYVISTKKVMCWKH